MPPRQRSGVGKRMAAALSLRRFRLEPSADRLRESLLLSRWVGVGCVCGWWEWIAWLFALIDQTHITNITIMPTNTIT